MKKVIGRKIAVLKFCIKASKQVMTFPMNFPMNFPINFHTPPHIISPMKFSSVILLIPLLISASLMAKPVLADPLQNAIARVSELNLVVQSQNERISKLEALLQNQGLIGMLNQLDALKIDVAYLRGLQEEQTHRQETADKRARDLYIDLDERIKEVASRPIPAPYDAVRLQTSKTLIAGPAINVASAPLITTPPTSVQSTSAQSTNTQPSTSLTSSPLNSVDPESEARAYEVAHNFIKTGKYADAINAFNDFIKQYPDGKLAANALYWIGISHVTGQSNFTGAADSYRRLLKEYPNSQKVPDAMLSLARAQIQMDDRPAARDILTQLISKHPSSKAAENGKKLLVTIE